MTNLYGQDTYVHPCVCTIIFCINVQITKHKDNNRVEVQLQLQLLNFIKGWKYRMDTKAKILEYYKPQTQIHIRIGICMYMYREPRRCQTDKFAPCTVRMNETAIVYKHARAKFSYIRLDMFYSNNAYKGIV